MPPHRRSRPSWRALLPSTALVVVAALAAPLPASAEEEPATVVGELLRAWAEHEHPQETEAHAHDGLLTWVETSDGDAVRVVSEDVDQIEVGSTVELVVGEETVDAATAEDGLEPAREVLAAEVVQAPPAEPAPAETSALAESVSAVTNQVTVVMMVPAGGAVETGRTVTHVVDKVQTDVRAFWSTQSAGMIEIGVTGQFDWFQGTTTCADPYGLFAEAAAHAGWTEGPGKHLLVYLPRNSSGCSYGLAELRSSPSSGGLLYVTDVATSLVAHEFGHNFGLGHSAGVQCDGAIDTGTCQTLGYRDYHDVMGGSWEQVGSLNAPQASRIGLLPEAAVQSVAAPVSTATTVTLSAQGTRVGTRVIRLTDTAGTVWSLEYRSAQGQDAWLGTTANRFGLDSGVQLRRTSGVPNTSALYDATPSATADWPRDVRAAFPVGKTISIAGGDFAVHVESVGDTSAQVRIARGVPPGASTVISAAYDRSGGLDGPLGYPTADERCGLLDDGCVRTYDHGAILWTAKTGAYVVHGPIHTAWAQAGAERSGVGYPVTDTACGTRDAGCYQVFQRGWMYVSAGTSATVLRGGIRERWQAAGAEWGALSYPTAGERCGLSGGGCSQTFANGLIVWSPAAGARLMHGPIGPHWLGQGGLGVVGYPVTDTTCGLRNSGCYQLFERGAAYDSAGSDPAFVRGGVRERWQLSGSEWGPLGYPTSGERCGLSGGGCSQSFAGGAVVWSPVVGAKLVLQRIAGHWSATGGVTGVGYPLSDTVCGLRSGGCYQLFERGSVYVSSATPPAIIRGAIRSRWQAGGAEWGTLGYPLEDERSVSGGAEQRFQGGTLFWSAADGSVRQR